ncbi:uncharacterized protein NP_5156A [Natronomonas pharaonis DSM 2160]|uniref:Uncharacterized protein n=1 Tax=Natronomonas pharaonis (strain ATCC 35678 / DSM 2160 / CIP 103997 / JCM 8858 / NBRC 14720 / NCIMB 2260 / Gabara) TaxID=348780 RepID=A0A1U7EZC5_NATPD|nr:hypothetical protein [Natronomonas pharaonis]CAI50669.1 uncharacterized protein NP_5156A [Natronomonas pharaonis DSM 2160]
MTEPSTADGDAPAEALDDAATRLDQLQSELEADGLDRSTLETLADAYRSVETVLDRWEERATDWDDFEGYVKFRNDLAGTLDSIPDDIPDREAFVDADSHVKTGGVSKSLNESDFEAAREALAPVRARAEQLDELQAAESALRDARKAAKRRLETLEDRIAELERAIELGDADLDAPVEKLKDPMADYNEGIEAAFEAFLGDASAREVLSFIQTAAETPLVEYTSPPEALVSYLDTEPAGDHTLSELLEYAEYSPSKLAHYVDDPDRLKRRVATNRTYLEGLSAAPLQLDWPPAAAETLRFQVSERLPLAAKLADEPTVTALRTVSERTRRDDYEELRTAAAAREELTKTERQRLQSGAIEAELEAAREERTRLRSALGRTD